jgi:hypothetical protein
MQMINNEIKDCMDEDERIPQALLELPPEILLLEAASIRFHQIVNRSPHK